MIGDEDGWTRADHARWFLRHDEPDEAARALEPGDELTLGQSDYLDLAAALSRRGLSATYEEGRVAVLAADGWEGRKPATRAPFSAAGKTARSAS